MHNHSCDSRTDCKCKDPEATENRIDEPPTDDEDGEGSGQNSMSLETDPEKKKI